MWIQVRSFDGKKSLRVDSLSKLTKIEDLRKLLVDHFEAPVENQRLFYRGKQLVDGHSLYDYSVGLNDIIQLMVKAVQPVESTPQSDDEQKADSDKENKEPEVEEVELNEADIKDSVYKVGDVIDARDMTMGAWFEAKITQVSKAPKVPVVQDNHKETVVKQVLTESTLAPMDTNTENTNKKDENENKMDSKKVDVPTTNDGSAELTAYNKLFDIVKNDGFLYHILYEGYDEDDIVKLNCGDVRPRAKQNIKLSDVKIGDVVMANYNVEEPDTRGFWYDCVITGKQNTRTIKSLKATVYFGPDLTPLENCKLLFVDEIFACETPGTQFTAEDVKANPAVSPVKRTNKPDCDHCLDNPKKKCKHCACCVCAGKHDPDKQILCDECNKAYHLTCLDPPLSSLPEEDDWYCHDCKIDDSEIVKAGEKLKESKKKSKMASNSSTTNRDWGRGMACVGRQKTCTVVPTNHFGPIPGVEVGTMWKFRVQVSEAGVHRPHVAGIAGRENEGAYSIVLSGGYEDDTDNGDTFLYTGSGGRDLSGNKRTAEQSCDQTLTRMNKALAKMCNAPVDVKNGATSKDWRSGKPVRVVRSCKLGKHSKFAPDEGNRYDGIYKVVRYWPEKGKSGFIVWRYMLQRDDPTPAPWTSKGKKRIEELGLTIQYPEGYLEAQAEKERLKNEGGTPAGKGKKGKRKHNEDEESEEGEENIKKKIKAAKYQVESDIMKLIKGDDGNKKVWEEALVTTSEGRPKFLSKVEELFTCICCQDLVFKPVTTLCFHNICKSCLKRAFKAEVFSCPACRTELGKDYSMPINETLSELLVKLFPGYDAGR